MTSPTKPSAPATSHAQTSHAQTSHAQTSHAQTSHAQSRAAAFDDRCDFILFLQRRLRVNRRQARNLLSAWMQEFKPHERAASERRGRA